MGSETQVKMMRIRKKHADTTHHDTRLRSTEEAFLVFWVILTTFLVVSVAVFCVGHMLWG